MSLLHVVNISNLIVCVGSNVVPLQRVATFHLSDHLPHKAEVVRNVMLVRGSEIKQN